jgi:hypothetical protein
MVCGKQISQDLCNDIFNQVQTIDSSLVSKQDSVKISKQIGYSSFGKKISNYPYSYLSDDLK